MIEFFSCCNGHIEGDRASHWNMAGRVRSSRTKKKSQSLPPFASIFGAKNVVLKVVLLCVAWSLGYAGRKTRFHESNLAHSATISNFTDCMSVV